MTVTDKTDNHEGVQLSQKAFLLVSLLQAYKAVVVDLRQTRILPK